MANPERWKQVRTITVITEPAPEKPGVRLGVGEKEITAVEFIPPSEIDSIRLEAEGRFESDFESVDGIHGRFTFVPNRPLSCELKREATGKVLRCRCKV